MLTELVRPGERIEIKAVAHAIMGKASDKQAYTSRVYDILDDEQLEILMPMDGTKLLLLPVGGEYEFCFYTKRGLYQCFVRVIDRYKSNNSYILLCELTSALGKYQRREYYRYSCVLPLKTRELMDEELKAIEENKFRMQMGLKMEKCQVVDISGGGMRFTAPVAYEPGKQIAVCFGLTVHGKETIYELVGDVLSSKENELQRGVFEHRLQFTVINNKQREEIIRYIFEEERKSRSRLAE